MKRILHISKYYAPFVGGVEQIARNCVLALDGLYDQKVICFDHERGRKDSRGKIDGTEVIRCAQEALIASQALGRTYGKRLKQVLYDFQPDIIIFHYPNPFVGHYLLEYIQPQARLIVYWHLDIVKQRILKHFFYGQNRRLLSRADKIIATSPDYIDGSPWLRSVREKCVVVPNCVDEERLAVGDREKARAIEIRQENEGKAICLSVGRHVPYKGYAYLIKASRLLDDRFRIYIAGKGPLTGKLKKAARQDGKIRFLGLVPDEELKAYLLACDIYCFPSITKNEAFGVALAEGMYYGKPAVTFTIKGSGVNYVNLDGVTGIECPNRDHRAFARALKRLADDPRLAHEYGEAAKARVKGLFLNGAFIENIKGLLRDI